MMSRLQPPSKPKRPLSAYNLFFRLERDRILAGQQNEACESNALAASSHFTSSKISAEDVAKISDEKRYRVVRRQDRKKHGKIGFAELAKLIARKWKNLSESERCLLEERAKVEKRKHNELMKDYAKKLLEYKKQEQNQEELDVGHTEEGTPVVPESDLLSQTASLVSHSKERKTLPLRHEEELSTFKSHGKQTTVSDQSPHCHESHTQQQQMYMMMRQQQQQQQQQGQQQRQMQQMHMMESFQKEEAFAVQQNKAFMIQQQENRKHSSFDRMNLVPNNDFFGDDNRTTTNMISSMVRNPFQREQHYQIQPRPVFAAEIFDETEHEPFFYDWDFSTDCGYGSTNISSEIAQAHLNQPNANAVPVMTMMRNENTNFGVVSPLPYCEPEEYHPMSYGMNHRTPMPAMHLHKGF